MNHTSCAKFIDIIGLDFKDELNNDQVKAKSFGILSDGSTDSLLTEKKIIYFWRFDLSLTSFC